MRVKTRASGSGVPSRWRPAGIFEGGSPDAAAILQFFFKYGTHFKAYFGPNCC